MVTSGTRCVREVSYTLSLRFPCSCSDTNHTLSMVSWLPGPGGDEHSPASSPRPDTCHPALSAPHPLKASTIYVPSLSGHLLALEVTSKVSGHTGFPLGQPDIEVLKPSLWLASANRSCACSPPTVSAVRWTEDREGPSVTLSSGTSEKV